MFFRMRSDVVCVDPKKSAASFGDLRESKATVYIGVTFQESANEYLVFNFALGGVSCLFSEQE